MNISAQTGVLKESGRPKHQLCRAPDSHELENLMLLPDVQGVMLFLLGFTLVVIQMLGGGWG